MKHDNHRASYDALYIKVSQDKFRLIEAVADSPGELAEMLGTTANNVSSNISHGWGCFERVKYEKGGLDDAREE